MEERRRRIVGLVKQNGTIAFAELTTLFPDVSEMTLRKDLKHLDSAGQIIRIHGGARSMETVSTLDTPLRQRMAVHADKKREIAQKARNLIPADSSIFLDSGSTTTELAKVFPDQPGMIFTGGLTCINELCAMQEPEIYVLGGRLNKGSLSVRDMAMASMIEGLHFDIAFISVNGYTKANGFTCRSSFRWALEKVVIRRSAKVILLMDSSKVGISHAFSICMPSSVDMLISDAGLSPEARKDLEAEGVTVL